MQHYTSKTTTTTTMVMMTTTRSYSHWKNAHIHTYRFCVAFLFSVQRCCYFCCSAGALFGWFGRSYFGSHTTVQFVHFFSLFCCDSIYLVGARYVATFQSDSDNFSNFRPVFIYAYGSLYIFTMSRYFWTKTLVFLLSPASLIRFILPLFKARSNDPFVLHDCSWENAKQTQQPKNEQKPNSGLNASKWHHLLAPEDTKCYVCDHAKLEKKKFAHS